MDVDNDNENEVLCERIINAIHAVFLKDAELSSFEIIPTEHNFNKSPVLHVEHNLGLESWCAKHVYAYAHKQLLKYRGQTLKLTFESDVLTKYLNIALLINPDVMTFWHIRMQLVQKNRLKMNKEFQFTTLVLSKKPKSNEAFSYRRWLFQFQSSESIDWQNEIGICERCADRCKSNYHAWSHRQWVLQNDPELLRFEIIRSEKFMKKHISDYSCCHYRQVLLQKSHETCFCPNGDFTSITFLIKAVVPRELLVEESVFNYLLPNVDMNSIRPKRKECFLFCLNFAARDMAICERQSELFGSNDCFVMHRRAMLKFIVEQIIHYTLGDYNEIYVPTPTSEQVKSFQAQLCSFDYSKNVFLNELLKSESLYGKKQCEWLKLFLGFKSPDFFDKN